MLMVFEYKDLPPDERWGDGDISTSVIAQRLILLCSGGELDDCNKRGAN
jgi:hypothetical protein